MNTEIEIEALHIAIEQSIIAKYPGVFVGFYPRPGEKIQTPAILLEIEDIQAGDPDDMGTEQMPVRVNFNAYCVLPYQTGNKMALRSMAAALMFYIRGKRWGQPVSAADVSGASPDSLSGEASAYEVMRVEFSHEAILGSDVWEGVGFTPTEVYLGEVPNIGQDHVDDYNLIASSPQ